jgi:hypothetical protein
MPSRVVRVRLADAARAALVEVGLRPLKRSALSEEVRRLSADPRDSDERSAVMADMNAVSGDWPK